jgi:predicted RNA-binding Zn-ribbon protein involved in translation (DUF1610 family)
MNKSLRLSEKWFRRGLWLVAFVFAGFLTGLGGAAVGDLPKVGPQVQTDDFIDKQQADPLRHSIKAAELLPDAQRREELSCDTALARLAKNVCSGCERPVDLKDVSIDFCPHCGIGLHDHCHACDTRKSAFAKFCHACGAADKPAVNQSSGNTAATA